MIAFALADAPPLAAQAAYEVLLGAGTAHQVRLPAGQAATVRTPRDIGDIRVADPAVAEVAPLTAQSLYLLGKGVGRTTVTVYDTERAPIGVLQVEVGVDVSDLSATIRRHVPNGDVTVSTVNGRLRLGGSVPNGEALATVLDLARQYAGEDFINALSVTESQQVLLEVRFVEASRRAGRELGINIGVTDPNDGGGRGVFTGSTGARTDPETGVYVPGLSYPNAGTGSDAFRFDLTGNPAFGTLITQVISAGLNVDLFIRAIEQRGLGRSLAEPNLTALSGSTASFLAGGEFPIPVRGADGEVTVEFREFGVRLTFTPIVLADGLINLKLAPEVSQLDRSISVDGVPGLITRRTETTVELRDGQSFAISGLLQSINERQQDQVPWLDQVPVLGTLFRSSSFIQSETDLVVIVTPRLVRPARPGEMLQTPLDGSRMANDPEFFLFGMMEIDDAALAAFRNGADVDGPTGHILDLPKAVRR